MGHLTPTNLSEREAQAAAHQSDGGTHHRRWPWILALLVLVAIGVWYFRGPRASTEAQGPASQGAPGRGQGRQGMGAGQFTVPVVVAQAQRGDLPVYFNGLGTVTASNTVTV